MTRHTPLTLEFIPETADLVAADGSTAKSTEGLVVVEPSMQVSGRIFLCASPTSEKRYGVHLPPEEARAVRDHLSKLLLEPETPQERPQSPAMPGQAESIQSRIDRAVQRLQAEKAKRNKGAEFRLEFRIGKLQGVIGRLRDR
jgi:hypothetical protein